jgi:hypothetical protein
VSAKENLTLLFEKNRQTFEQTMEAHLKQRKKSRQLPAEDFNTLERRFLTEFIRLHGILFTRISMEKMPNIQQEAIRDFEHLLAGSGDQLSDMMLKLTIMIIFTLENSRKQQSTVVQPIQPNPVTAPVHNVYFQHAISLAFDFMSKIVRYSAESDFCYLSAVVVFLKYLDKNRNLLQESDATGFIQNFIEFLQILSARNADFRPTKVSTQTTQNVCLAEDVEILGFSYVEGFGAPHKLTRDKTPVPDELALKVRIERLSQIVSNLLVDNNVRIYYDYANKIFTMVRIDNHLRHLSNEEEEDTSDEDEEDMEESATVGNYDEQHKNQFITSGFNVIEEAEDELGALDDDELLFNDDNGDMEDDDDFVSGSEKHSPPSTSAAIMQPFGLSSNTYPSQAQPTSWQSASPPGNLMSQLLNKQPQQPVQQQQYGSFFSNNNAFFNQQQQPQQSHETSNAMYPPPLYQDGTWANQFGNQTPGFFPSAAHGSRVIEQPFQLPNQVQQPYNLHQFGSSPPVAHQQQFNQNGSNSNNSNIIESPFLAWRSPAFYQQQQQPQQQQQTAHQQQQQQRYPLHNNNSFIQ